MWSSLYTLHSTHYYAMPSAICAILKSTRLNNNNNKQLFVVLLRCCMCDEWLNIFFFSSETCSESLRAKWVQRKAHAILHTNMHKATCSFFSSFLYYFCLFVDNNQYKKRKLIFRKAEEIFSFFLFSFFVTKNKDLKKWFVLWKFFNFFH